MLVLQVVVQAQALGGEMLADHGHGQVGAILAAELGGQGEAQVTGRVGATLGLGQQVFPIVPGQAAAIIVGAGPFAAVVEEAFVVVLRLKRSDLGRDEGVQFRQIAGQFGGQFEVHFGSSLSLDRA
ncbi:hypothetical protein D3C81_1221830 [compost metagenome]